MNTQYLFGLLSGVAVAILFFVLLFNGKKWYNQLFNKSKKA
ncbi:hypothetical protein SAMN05216323_101838 [Williamwhitmania taraxaci]|uniref:Uncharacterized protein n=1 Tax=Williamwhitmania taraxaci TaxID=1640674 RepID=A0A1G6J3T4_9BACT|nr:hypothetical protein SAMN05216323_101838 [Williamwhitmania taraxaci]